MKPQQSGRRANMSGLCETAPTTPREASINVSMTPTASPSSVRSEFNDFLYSPIGEDKNGLLVTVLSALARQNVDPWQQAADLDGLPRDTAVQKLTSIISALPGHRSMPDDPTPIAVRLIALLPGRGGLLTRRSNAADMLSPARPQSLPKALWIAAYVALLLFNLWLFSK
jgi:hypothetical protein